jgi:hypothetical protein
LIFYGHFSHRKVEKVSIRLSHQSQQSLGFGLCNGLIGIDSNDGVLVQPAPHLQDELAEIAAEADIANGRMVSRHSHDPKPLGYALQLHRAALSSSALLYLKNDALDLLR